MLKLGGLKDEAFVVAAENGALTVGVNENEGLVARAIGHTEQTCFNACAGKFGAMQLRGVVVAEFADVARAKSPDLASNHGAGDLAARENAGGFEFDFRAACGIFTQRDERVSGVEADADNIDFGNGGHWK